VIEQELLDILEKEEIFWRQRSRENRLLEGESNTYFFIEWPMDVREKNMISSLKHGDSVIQGDEELLTHATDFYMNLFGHVDDSGVRLSGDIWSTEEKIK
jgi:hypothetical protein